LKNNITIWCYLNSCDDFLYIQVQLRELQEAIEEESQQRNEAHEALVSAERRAQALALELEELQKQLESTERARKVADTELHEANDRVAELSNASGSLIMKHNLLYI